MVLFFEYQHNIYIDVSQCIIYIYLKKKQAITLTVKTVGFLSRIGYNETMDENKVLDTKDYKLDKRPWLMDWLFEIGHNMAIINHCYEKIQYLQKDIENAGLDEDLIRDLTDKIAHYHKIRELAYEAYDTEMSYLFDTIPEAQKDCRCLLKHALLKLVLAQETADVLNNAVGDINLHKSFEVFAGVVSLALGIEFNTCIRCIYDGIKNRANEAKTPTHSTTVKL